MNHYWRCHDCLAVVTTASAADGLRCSCGGRLIYLGTPRRSRLVLTGKVVPCDARCTGATGPNCDCSCSGRNHGTNRLVDVVIDNGAVPRVSGGGDPERAAAFREARAAAMARIDAMPGRADSLAGRWIPRSRWDAIRAALDELNAATKLTSHKGRLARLARVADGGAS